MAGGAVPELRSSGSGNRARSQVSGGGSGPAAVIAAPSIQQSHERNRELTNPATL